MGLQNVPVHSVLLPPSPSPPSKEEAISWTTSIQPLPWLPSVKGAVGASVSLLEVFALVPITGAQAKAREMFSWKSVPQPSWQPNLKRLKSFAPNFMFMVNLKLHLRSPHASSARLQ